MGEIAKVEVASATYVADAKADAAKVETKAVGLWASVKAKAKAVWAWLSNKV